MTVYEVSAILTISAAPEKDGLPVYTAEPLLESCRLALRNLNANCAKRATRLSCYTSYKLDNVVYDTVSPYETSNITCNQIFNTGFHYSDNFS